MEDHPAIRPEAIDLMALPSLPFTERKTLPPLQALYFVCGHEQEILYIGSTKNLNHRFLQHHLQGMFLDAPHVVRIAWLVMADLALLRQIERLCIMFWRPRYNSSIPSNALTAKFIGLMLRLTPTLHAAIVALARQEKRSLNSQILIMLERDMATFYKGRL